MRGGTNETRRLHLITRPKRPDVSFGMEDAPDREPASVIYSPLAESMRNHRSNAEAATGY